MELPPTDARAVVTGESLVWLHRERVGLLARHLEAALLQLQRKHQGLDRQHEAASQHDKTIGVRTGHRFLSRFPALREPAFRMPAVRYFEVSERQRSPFLLVFSSFSKRQTNRSVDTLNFSIQPRRYWSSDVLTVWNPDNGSRHRQTGLDRTPAPSRQYSVPAGSGTVSVSARARDS